MKRLFQALALLQLFLVVALAVRTVRVWTTALPEFGDIPDLPATSPVPPARPAPKVSAAVTDSIVEHDLFDEQRGQNKDIVVDGAPADEPPVPPPTTVKLMGVMRIGQEPVAILVDTSVKPEQQSVRKGDMFGEYEIGEILPTGLILLGGGGQQFQIPLRVEAAAPGVVGQPVAGAPPPRPGAAAAAAAAHAATPARPVPARPAPAGAAADQKAMSARDRAQAIAQHNAEMRKAGSPKGGQGGGEGGEKAAAPDPVQARLEALKALREAAKAH